MAPILTWLNPDGYDAPNIIGSHNPVLYRIHLHEPASAALTLCDKDGVLYQPCRNEVSDFLSIPRLLTWLVARDDCPRSGILHDSGYRQGGLWVSRNGGHSWHFTRMTRKQIDLLLWGGIRAEKLGPCKSWMVYAGVRVGGWAKWNEYRKEKP